MPNTFEGKKMGKLYRYLPSHSKKPLTRIVFASLVVLALITGNAAVMGNNFTDFHAFLSILVASVWSLMITGVLKMVMDEEPKLFQRYVILKSSLSDTGESSILVRWLRDGSERWINEESKPIFRHLTDSRVNHR